MVSTRVVFVSSDCLRWSKSREKNVAGAVQIASSVAAQGLLDPQSFDAGKKTTGRKRHILVDTLGLLLSVAVHPANVQDRDGVALVLDRRTRRLFPFIERIYGDGGYQGPKAAKAAAKRLLDNRDRRTLVPCRAMIRIMLKRLVASSSSCIETSRMGQ